MRKIALKSDYAKVLPRFGAVVFVLIFGVIGAKLLFFGHANPSLVGDLNGDGKVDSSDVSIFQAHWGNSGSGIAEDLNGDGKVNIFDLSLLLSNFGKTSAAIPSHTETWAYDDGCNGGTGATSALVQQWVTYAETNCGPNATKALTDCHVSGTVYCKVMAYLDTNIIYYASGNASPQWPQFSAAASENWYLHEASSSTTRINTTAYNGGYFDNQTNAAVQSFYQSYVRNNYPNYDGLFMDDSGASLRAQLYSANQTSSYEVSTDAALQAAHAAMAAALTNASGIAYPQVDNTLPDCGNPNEAAQGIGPTGNMMTGPVVGMLAEGCPEYNGTITAYYPELLDDLAYIINSTSGFGEFLSYAPSGAAYQAQSRRVQEATVLLAYEPGRIVDWADLEDDSSNLAVWPEEGLYPTSPLQSMANPSGTGCLAANSGTACSSGGHNSLEVAPNVYRREFSQCYNQGQAIGKCAVLMNDSSSAVTTQASWLTQSYSHAITFNGGDVQSGGTLNLSGAAFSAGTTSIPADDALLLTP